MHNAFVIYPVDTRFKECILYNSKVSRLMIQYILSPKGILQKDIKKLEFLNCLSVIKFIWLIR